MIPTHMAVKHRNQRIYDSLLATGLYVEAVFCADNPDTIDYIIVGAGPPADRLTAAETSAQEPPKTLVDGVVQSPFVAGEIRAPKGDRGNVINLPPVV